MTLLDSPEPSRRGRGGLWLGVLALCVVVATALWLRRPAPPSPRPSPPPAASSPRSTPKPAVADEGGTIEVTANLAGAVVFVDGGRRGPAPLRASGLPGGEHRVRVEKDGYAAFERSVHVIPGREVKLEARFEAERPRLRVESDVPGASVFLDHKFVGVTPLDLPDVSPGSHRLNVSAEGYGMHAEDVDLTRTREVQVDFKEVRLDASLDAVHKHGVGSCEGRLSATPAGLRFEAAKGSDSFTIALADVEALDVDYLKKNLRLRVRGGRNYNFGHKGGNADVLFVFRKQVEEARQKSR